MCCSVIPYFVERCSVPGSDYNSVQPGTSFVMGCHCKDSGEGWAFPGRFCPQRISCPFRHRRWWHDLSGVLDSAKTEKPEARFAIKPCPTLGGMVPVHKVDKPGGSLRQRANFAFGNVGNGVDRELHDVYRPSTSKKSWRCRKYNRVGGIKTTRVGVVKGTKYKIQIYQKEVESVTLMMRLHARCYRCSYSSDYLGAGEGTGVATGTSAGDASSGKGRLRSEPSSSEVSGDDVGEASMSSGDALDGKGASEGVGLRASGKTFRISC